MGIELNVIIALGFVANNAVKVWSTGANPARIGNDSNCFNQYV